MNKISINLPKNKRLDLFLVNRRATSNYLPLFPNLEVIRSVRKGSKLSRYFRHVFEHKRIKKILGANLVAIVIASNLIPSPTNAFESEAEENMIIDNNLALTTEKGIQYPTEAVEITQGYRFYHPGIDLNGQTGDPIRPIMKGKVAAIDYSNYAYGNAILIDHGDNLASLYAHLSEILVEKDQLVDMKMIIGKMGATGRASGDHLHLEVRKNGVPINPFSVLPMP